MKKIIASFALLASSLAYPCADYNPEYYYYNLFMQETINSPQYFPFLLDLSSTYYSSTNKIFTFKNENIEEWQKYLHVEYNQAYYLVFKSKETDIRSLIKGQKINNDTLSFITPDFVTKNIQALKYIAYSKYMEPYMSVSFSKTNYWMDSPSLSVNDLDYEKVINVLKRSWNAETDKELKLRYGYQLVRLAHYKKDFEQAIEYFNQYVASLKYYPVMYYYALDQKAGAERGLGNLIQANYDFFTVFTHTKNIKSKVYSSLILSQPKQDEYGYNFSISDNFLENLLKNAKTEKEKNDAYLLLGYQDFNNPLSSLKKIIQNSPDAVQAKVLMARAVNQLERNYLHISLRCGDPEHCAKDNTDKRLPLITDDSTIPFFQQTLDISLKQSLDRKVKDTDFWNLTTSYLYFLQKNYKKSREFLSKVHTEQKIYKEQKIRLEMLLDICEQPIITPEFEKILFSKYKNIFHDNLKNNDYTSTQSFIIDILANRYFLQKQYAQSFLLHNQITDLEYNPNLSLLEDIVALYHKKNKSPMDVYLVKNISPYGYHGNVQKKQTDFNFDEYVAQMKGNVYLSQGELQKALAEFQKVSNNFTLFSLNHRYGEEQTLKPNEYNGYSNIPYYIFGYNKIESFQSPESEVMGVDYLKDFKFIKSTMNKRELTEALISLQKIAQKENEQSSKANYLLGNFFYNTSSTGYYRHILRFDKNNQNGTKFYDNNTHLDIFAKVYFKDYPYTAYFLDYTKIPTQYLEKALSLAKDRELKARIVFALSKVEQEDFYLGNNLLGYYWYYRDKLPEGDGILIKNRRYFASLSDLKDTQFYKEVKSNCLYFEYYVTHY